MGDPNVIWECHVNYTASCKYLLFLLKFKVVKPSGHFHLVHFACTIQYFSLSSEGKIKFKKWKNGSWYKVIVFKPSSSTKSLAELVTKYFPVFQTYWIRISRTTEGGMGQMNNYWDLKNRSYWLLYKVHANALSVKCLLCFLFSSPFIDQAVQVLRYITLKCLSKCNVLSGKQQEIITN